MGLGMTHRIARNVVAGVVLSAVALMLGGTLAGSAASQPLPRRSLDPFPSVLSPRGGQRLPARPALVKLYLGYAQVLEARLNGRLIGSDLLFGRASRAVPCASLPVSETRGGSCELLASPSDGLRYGVNLLTVRFRF